jgi:hypothetical protein
MIMFGQTEKTPSLWEQISKLPLELKLGKYEVTTGGGRVRVEAGKKPEAVSIPITPAPRRAGFDFGSMLPILGIGAAVAVILFLVMSKR